ncbi:MAG: Ig-like domain-containing protein, partial [Synergistaceae bacterium]|nr:Ig-like domain-containing protein [Synergistaceae bacterium]
MRKFLNLGLASLIVVLICGSALAAEEPSSILFAAVSYDIGVVGDRAAIWANVSPPEASIDDDWIVSFKVVSAEIAAVYSYANAGERIRAIVTGLAPGSTSIDLKVTSADGVTSFDASCIVYVSPVPVSSVSLNVNDKTFYEGYTFKLSAEVKPDNATDKTLTWSSSAANIVNVNQSGNVRCLQAGFSNVAAMAGNKYDVCKITVKARPEWLEEQDAVKVLPDGAAFDEDDGMLVWRGLNDAFEKQKVILRNDDLYGYHIIGFYAYEERGEFKDGWR